MVKLGSKPVGILIGIMLFALLWYMELIPFLRPSGPPAEGAAPLSSGDIRQTICRFTAMGSNLDEVPRYHYCIIALICDVPKRGPNLCVRGTGQPRFSFSGYVNGPY